MWKKNISLADAKQEMIDVVALLNVNVASKDQIKIKRLLVLSANPWDGITGSDDRP